MNVNPKTRIYPVPLSPSVMWAISSKSFCTHAMFFPTQTKFHCCRINISVTCILGRSSIAQHKYVIWSNSVDSSRKSISSHRYEGMRRKRPSTSTQLVLFISLLFRLIRWDHIQSHSFVHVSREWTINCGRRSINLLKYPQQQRENDTLLYLFSVYLCIRNLYCLDHVCILFVIYGVIRPGAIHCQYVENETSTTDAINLSMKSRFLWWYWQGQNNRKLLHTDWRILGCILVLSLTFHSYNVMRCQSKIWFWLDGIATHTS